MSLVAWRVLLLFFSTQLVAGVQSNEEEAEVVLLPMEWSSDNATVALRFWAFGEKVDLLLKRNAQLVAPNFEAWKREGDDSSRMGDGDSFSSCHYLHENSYSSAAVSLCSAGVVRGLVFLEKDSLEIRGLNEEECKAYERSAAKVRSASLGKPHVIKRRRGIGWDAGALRVKMSAAHEQSWSHNGSARAAEPLTIELAVFLDETAYKLFEPHFSGDEGKMIELLLAYVNNIQALYHHPSLGQRIDLALVRLELMQRQPRDLAHLDGERSQALEAFCKYSERLNPPRDEDAKHWDMGLYVSGLDLYAVEEGQRNAVTMGLAPVGGVCNNRYGCVIAEFGVYNHLDRPFPSAGFTSVYIAAHEMAHNLGMHHDSSGNDCPKNGFIMSPSRGVKGETQWSPCSRRVALSLGSSKSCLLDKPSIDYFLQENRHLQHDKRFGGLPGREWTAKRQCEILLRDHDAFAESLHSSCSTLRCRSPQRSGVYLAGPALDGTKCSEQQHAMQLECRAGECLPIEREPLATTSVGWSEWQQSSCQSGCTRGSWGFFERRRSCLASDPSKCPGLQLDVRLCKDSALCEAKSRKRLSVEEHAGLRCAEFSARGIEAIEATGGGLQAHHQPESTWMACAVFCKRKDSGAYFAPRVELAALGVDAYLPDGTWCHRQAQQDYFCRRHHCLPQDFRFDKSLPDELP